jgi:glycosyltransferase involved in cell wall biosynthesis
VPSVLHLLPHPGGGGEKYIDLLQGMPGYRHRRECLSASRSALAAVPSMVARAPRLRREARDYDLVHIHGDTAAMIALPLLHRRPGVVSTHGLSFLRRARGVPLLLARARFARVMRTAGLVVCSSQDERAELIELAAGGGGKLAVVPNGIELPAAADGDRRGATRAALGLASEETVALYLGLLDRYKDPLTAVRAAEGARLRGARLTLLVAGDGPLLEAVRGAAGPATRVLGFREDAERLLEAADIFVMPSRREGSSYALLEAMGHGLAIVASHGPGIPEMLGSAGILAAAGDVDAFADGLLVLASDAEERGRLGASARARVAEHYGVERFTDSMRSLYEELLEEEGSRRRS